MQQFLCLILASNQRINQKYSVKNNPFASDLLQAVGLKDSPIKLNADQATSFAALRLVAMRVSQNE